jgi:hypothetical protein
MPTGVLSAALLRGDAFILAVGWIYKDIVLD